MAQPTIVDDLKREVAKTPLPRHVGVIMDGNGRWAKARGLSRVEGHRAGSESVRAVTRVARHVGLECLSLYAFSTQNWLRPPGEVSALMELLREYAAKERAEVMDNGIRVVVSGDASRLPARVREPLDALCRDSSRNRDMTLNLALSYGGREEIVAACRSLVESARRGEPFSVDAASVASRLWTGRLPDLDLVVRTSGEKRLSNFMLWSAAYAEFHFTEQMWPDFREADFLGAVLDFQRRERRFGLAPDQSKPGGGASS